MTRFTKRDGPFCQFFYKIEFRSHLSATKIAPNSALVRTYQTVVQLSRKTGFAIVQCSINIIGQFIHFLFLRMIYSVKEVPFPKLCHMYIIPRLSPSVLVTMYEEVFICS